MTLFVLTSAFFTLSKRIAYYVITAVFVALWNKIAYYIGRLNNAVKLRFFHASGLLCNIFRHYWCVKLEALILIWLLGSINTKHCEMLSASEMIFVTNLYCFHSWLRAFD